MAEYRKSFLDEIKSLLLYLVKFSEYGSILPKKYPDNCIVDSSDQRPIILIIYDEST